MIKRILCWLGFHGVPQTAPTQPSVFSPTARLVWCPHCNRFVKAKDL